MWGTQCHKPVYHLGMVNIAPIDGDDLGLVYETNFTTWNIYFLMGMQCMKIDVEPKCSMVLETLPTKSTVNMPTSIGGSDSTYHVVFLVRLLKRFQLWRMSTTNFKCQEWCRFFGCFRFTVPRKRRVFASGLHGCINILKWWNLSSWWWFNPPRWRFHSMKSEFWGVLLWMEEILHQLTDGLSHYFWGFNHPFGGAGFLPCTLFWVEPSGTPEMASVMWRTWKWLDWTICTSQYSQVWTILMKCYINSFINEYWYINVTNEHVLHIIFAMNMFITL